MKVPRCPLEKAASLFLLAAFSSNLSAATLIGPGAPAATTGTDSGDRLNVSEANILTSPGFYTITDFSLSGTSASGTLTPFLVWDSGSNTYRTSWIGPTLASAIGTVSTSSNTVVYLPGARNQAAFYTAGGGYVGFTGGGVTDHDNSFTAPTGLNQDVSGFSNANLGRTYGFGATVQPVGGLTTLSSGFLSAAGSDGGERLNIDENGARTLGPGTYSLRDFSFQGTSATGSVVPVLVKSTGTNSYQTIWQGTDVPSASTFVQTNPSGTFTLNAPTTVYPAFYTRSGGRVAFVDGTGTTDHANSFTAPAYVNSTLSTFSNPNLTRQYSFGITVESVINPLTSGPGLVSTSGVDSGERLNIDVGNPLSLVPGLYSLESFTFNGTSAAGTVTPFLARSTGGSGSSQTYEILWQGSAVGAQNGTVVADLVDKIFFGTAQTVFAGFFTESGGRVAFANGGLTEHDSVFPLPTGTGFIVTGFSNPDLGRTYAFSLLLSVPEPARAALLLAGLLPLVLSRSRRSFHQLG